MVQSKKKKRSKLSRGILGKAPIELPEGYKLSSKPQGHQKSFTSTRTALHRDRKIKIKTTYRIEIDNEPLTLHTMVMDDGTVHCHGLPNYSFPSAVDLARSIIDASFLSRVDCDELGEGSDHQKEES